MSGVGIVTALRSEANCVTSLRLPYNKMVSVGDDSSVWFCGIGGDAARTAATGLHAGGVHALVSFGIAGALDSSLKPGDLVLPESIHAEQIQPVTLAWRSRLQQLLPSHLKIVGGTLASSPVTLTSEKVKRELATATGACAVDMESGAIADVAANAGIPFIAIRAIIDPVEFSPPIAMLSAIYPDGSVNSMRLLALILKRSVSLSELIHLAKGMHAARNTLSTVIQSAGIGLGHEPTDNSVIY